MSFVTPALAIGGIAAVAIPILIHLLFRRRRKPIEWAAMRFLMEAWRRQRRRLHLEQFLLLLVRCLIVALLGIALARPLLSGRSIFEFGTSRTVVLVIDNGLVSGVQDESGTTALQQQVDAAIELVQSLDAGDRVAVFTTAAPAGPLLNPPSIDHAAVTRLLRSIEPAAAASDLPAALNRVGSAIETIGDQADEVLVYLMSEFREGSARLGAPLQQVVSEELQDRVKLLATPPAEQPIENVQITSIDPVRSLMLHHTADGSGQVAVRLHRTGGSLDQQVSRVTLASRWASGRDGDDVASVPPQTVEWQPGQSDVTVDFTLRFDTSEDSEPGLIARIDDDALSADNQRYAVVSVRDEIRVVLIDRRQFALQGQIDRMSAGQWIRRALEPVQESPVSIIEVEPAALTAADLRTADAVVLSRPDLLPAESWDLLRQFVDSSGLLLITPPAEPVLHEWTAELTDTLSLPWSVGLEVTEHADGIPLADEQPRDSLLQMIAAELADLARPVVAYRLLSVATEQTETQPTLVFTDGTPMVLVERAGSGEQTDQDRQSSGAPVAGTDNQGTGTTTLGDGTNDAKRRAAPSNGLVVLLTVSPDLAWTNLPSKPLMVPLFQELIRQGLSRIQSSELVNVGMASNPGLPLTAADIRSADEQTLISIDDRGRLSQPLLQPGIYTVLDTAGRAIDKLAVNVEPAAGHTGIQSQPAVQAWLESSGAWQFISPREIDVAFAAADSASPLARTLLLAVVMLVIVETLLARYVSHASVGRPNLGWGGSSPAVGDRSDASQPILPGGIGA